MSDRAGRPALIQQIEQVVLRVPVAMPRWSEIQKRRIVKLRAPRPAVDAGYRG